MDDGAVLLADRWVARATADEPQPTVLVRSPYGRRPWVVLVAEQERRFAPLAMLRGLRKLPVLLEELPLSDLDQRVTGAEVAWFRQALADPEPEGAYWVARDFSAGVGKVSAPVQMIGG